MTTKTNRARPIIATLAATALLAMALPGRAASDSTAPQAKETPPYDAMFKRLDADKDGFVSADEATRQPRFMAAFREADEDRDNRLSRDEFVKAHSIYDRSRVGEYAADSLITAKVKAALVKDRSVSALAISVETAYGEVLLSGFVDQQSQAQRARAIASKIDGVKRVHDSLIVKG